MPTIRLTMRASRAPKDSRRCAHVVCIASLLAALSLATTPAVSTTISSITVIRAAILASCTISLGSSLNFGTLTVNSGNTVAATAAGTVNVLCDNAVSYTLISDAGLNPLSTQRRLRLGATSSYLNYDIYTDAGLTTAFPTTAGAAVSQAGSGVTQTLSVYGRVPAQAVSTVGTYTDTLTVSVNY